MTFWNTAPPQPTTLAGRLGAIIATIGVKIGHHLGANRHLEPILALAYHYLNRAAPRLERLIARWRAGKLTPRQARRAPPKAEGQPLAPKPRPDKPRLPSRNGWLVRLVQPTAQLIGQLQALVDSPEMKELLAAAPQAGRILRPLFRMLATPPPEILRLPPRLRAPRKPKPAPAVPRVTARERRAWLKYSPGPLRAPWPIIPRQKIVPN